MNDLTPRNQTKRKVKDDASETLGQQSVELLSRGTSQMRGVLFAKMKCITIQDIKHKLESTCTPLNE